MSAWAYRCRSCTEGDADWFVSQIDVAELPPDVRIVRVRVGRDWKCALLDRTRTVVVEDQLLRHVVASDEKDCPQCGQMLAAAESTPIANSTETAPGPAPDARDSEHVSSHVESRKNAMKVQAAAISVQGRQFVVVVSSRTLLDSPGEADMAIEDLQPYFGGAPVVLMAQKDDGSPSYYGDRQLVELLASIPIENMPWKEYPVG